MTHGFVVASHNGDIGIEAAVEVLRNGGSAVDSVIAGTRLVEANPDDHSVGYSGLPNLLGEVELDASVMEGHGLRAGSVATLRGYQEAIQLAREVMDRLPHVLIAGTGSERFAAELGLEPVDLLTPESLEVWQSRIHESDGPQGEYIARIRELVGQMTADPQLVDDEPPHGTVNFIARDANGRIASAVSTSGWAWKYPGRVGDSPIIGAGNYADDRYGAATCTGRGEMAQRACTAHSVVMFLRFGQTLGEAMRTAVEDLRHLDDPYASEMNVLAIDAAGNHGGASTTQGKTYVFMDESMTTYETLERAHVDIGL